MELSLRIFEPFLGVFDFVQLALESDCVLSANALEVGGVSVLLREYFEVVLELGGVVLVDENVDCHIQVLERAREVLVYFYLRFVLLLVLLRLSLVFVNQKVYSVSV